MNGRSKKINTLIQGIGQMLDSAIKDSGMTQRELAAQLGMSEARISQILSGKCNLTIQSMAKIATVLQLELKVELRKP